MTRTLIILNPAAHGQRARRRRERVESLAHGAVVQSTSRSGEAEGLTRRAVCEGFERIVAAGGDCTVNEVVNGLAGSNAALGVLLIGTMNVFGHGARFAGE